MMQVEAKRGAHISLTVQRGDVVKTYYRIVRRYIGVNMTGAVVLILELCMVAPVWAQTPREAVENALFVGPARICRQLLEDGAVREGLTGAQTDLGERCSELNRPTENGLVRSTAAGRFALTQVAAEEAASQGTSSIETSNNTIGARLAALRSGALGLSLRRYALHIDTPSLPGTLVASLVAQAADDRTELETAPELLGQLGFFATGSFLYGDKDETRSGTQNDIIESGFDFDAFSATAGVDYRFSDHVILGIAFDYLSTDVDLDAFSGSVDAKGFRVSIYGTYYVSDAFYIDGIVGIGWNDYEIERNIRYVVDTTTVDQTARSDTNGNQISLSFGAGYDVNKGGLTFGPFARLSYIDVNIDAYREDIDNTSPGFGWALEFDSQDVESLTIVLGVQASYAISMQRGVLQPHIRLEWEHEFKNDSRIITARFVNDPGGDPSTGGGRTPTRFATDDPDRNFFNLGVGFAAIFAPGKSAFVNYDTVLGLRDVTAHTFTLGVRREI